MSDKLERLRALAEKAAAITTYETRRRENRARLEALFAGLDLGQKVPDVEALFDFKAINLTGIALSSEQLGTVFAGKYVQIIAITYVEEEGRRRAKNISLRYFGRAEQLEEKRRRDIVEFILRWRLEKSFRGVDRYLLLLEKLA